MAIEAGLADEKAEPAAELEGDAFNFAAKRVGSPASWRARGETPVGARKTPNSARSASPHSPVVTPALAASIEAGADIGAARRRLAQRPQRLVHASLIALRSPRHERSHLLGLSHGGWDVDRILARGERRGLGIGEGVYADDDLLAALDRLRVCACWIRRASL